MWSRLVSRRGDGQAQGDGDMGGYDRNALWVWLLSGSPSKLPNVSNAHMSDAEYDRIRDQRTKRLREIEDVLAEIPEEEIRMRAKTELEKRGCDSKGVSADVVMLRCVHWRVAAKYFC